MKTYKTWEMIKKLTENPEKKFKRVGDQLEVSVDIDNCLLWKSGYPPFNINHIWEEVKKPVDFMAALNSREFVKVEHELATYTDYERLDLVMVDLADNLNADEFAEVIENGKWYIED